VEPERPQHDRPTACVIAQQYSFDNFVSLRFHSCNKKSSVLFKNIII
jgi:hypothetical protein